MKLLLKRFSTDENWCDDIDYGYIELTQKDAKDLLDRIRLIRRIKEQHGTTRALVFKDYYADFIDLDDETDEYCQRVWEEGVVELPEDFVLAKDRIHNTELDEMRIEDDEITWNATIKHTNVVVETRGVSVELLERIAGEKL